LVAKRTVTQPRPCMSLQNPARLADFYDAAIDAQLPEATRLAEICIHQYKAPNSDMTGLLSSGSPEVGNTGLRIRRYSCGQLVAFLYQLVPAHPAPWSSTPLNFG
jgi:hypothetical protein